MSGELDKGERHRGPSSPSFGRRTPITTIEEAKQVRGSTLCISRRQLVREFDVGVSHSPGVWYAAETRDSCCFRFGD